MRTAIPSPLRRAVLLALLLLSVAPALEAQKSTRHRLLSEMPEKERNEHLIAIAKEVYARPEYKDYYTNWRWERISVEADVFKKDGPLADGYVEKAKKGEKYYEVTFHARTESWMKEAIPAVKVYIYNCDASPLMIYFEGALSHFLNEPSRYPLKKK